MSALGQKQTFLYHFVVRAPDHTHDDPELKEDGYDPGDAVLIVHDDRGQIIHSIPF